MFIILAICHKSFAALAHYHYYCSVHNFSCICIFYFILDMAHPTILFAARKERECHISDPSKSKQVWGKKTAVQAQTWEHEIKSSQKMKLSDPPPLRADPPPASLPSPPPTHIYPCSDSAKATQKIIRYSYRYCILTIIESVTINLRLIKINILCIPSVVYYKI